MLSSPSPCLSLSLTTLPFSPDIFTSHGQSHVSVFLLHCSASSLQTHMHACTSFPSADSSLFRFLKKSLPCCCRFVTRTHSCCLQLRDIIGIPALGCKTSAAGEEREASSSSKQRSESVQ